MGEKNPKIDALLRKSKRWGKESEQLRNLLLELPLTEEVKWRQPCYTFNGGNVAIIGAFKEFIALAFFKGVLLKDKKKVLVAPGKNSQAVRQFRFTSAQEITKLKPTVRAYIKEAIALEKAGAKVDFKEKRKLVYPEELEAKFKKSAKLEKAFKALTPGRQRAYVLHFSNAKQSKTRAARIDKCAPDILAGKGLNDR